MKICPSCGAEIPEVANFCPKCRTKIGDTSAVPAVVPQPQVIYVDPADHTAEFDAKDIADNKLYALCVHLFGLIGIIVALLAAKDSGFVQFHVKLKMKFLISEILVVVVCSALSFLALPLLAMFVLIAILAVLEIIAFVQACKGEAKDAAIIKKIGFLK